MYCPLCAAEYRPGFTVCSDCQVDLVPERAQETLSDAASDSTPFALVWSGNDALTHAKICETLDREKIPARTLGSEDHLFNIGNRSVFEVYVPADLANRARAAITHDPTNEAQENTGSDILEIPADDGSPEGYGDYESGRAGRQNYDPQDATVEIWSGQDADMAAMIASSLRENRIISRSDPNMTEPESASDEARATKVFVFPEGEKRAREIVREIVNAVPPQ